MTALTTEGLRIRKLVTEFILTSPNKCFYLKEIHDENPETDTKIISNNVRQFIKTRLVKRIGRAYYEIINFVPPSDGNSASKPGKTEINANDLADQFIDGWNNMKSEIESLRLQLKNRETDNHHLSVALENAKSKMAEMDDELIKLHIKKNKTIKL